MKYLAVALVFSLSGCAFFTPKVLGEIAVVSVVAGAAANVESAVSNGIVLEREISAKH